MAYQLCYVFRWRWSRCACNPTRMQVQDTWKNART